MNLTTQQQAILDTFATVPALIVNAGPGCAKTFTMARCAHTRPTTEQPTIYGLAFNKDAAKKLTKEFPPLAKVSTLNSLGLQVWESHLSFDKPTRCRLNIKKSRQIVEDLRQNTALANDEVDDLLSLMRFAKSQGYLPPRSGSVFRDGPDFKALCELADVTPTPELENFLTLALHRSITLSYQGEIDFDDQGYMSTLFASSMAYPTPRYLFVDEAQDLTPLQLRFIQRLRAHHTIIVGDPHQAIYGFRGAMTDSFDRIHKAFPDATTLPLQVSFRLPVDIVAVLAEHNPNLRPGKSERGRVHTLESSFNMRELTSEFSGTQAILCRNNAPLYRVALACIATNVRFNLNDQGYGNALIRDIASLGNSQTRGADHHLLEDLTKLWLRRSLSLDIIQDKTSALAALMEIAQPRSASNLIQTIRSLLQKSNTSDAAHPLFLSTAHKAKGLEFDWVLHLDPHLIPSKHTKTPEALRQESNIAYVINSRSRQHLYFAESEQILIPGAPQPRRRPNTRYDQPI